MNPCCSSCSNLCLYSVNVSIGALTNIYGPNMYPRMLFFYNCAACSALFLQSKYDGENKIGFPCHVSLRNGWN